MRWSYCLLSTTFFLVFFFQNAVNSAPSTVKEFKPIEQKLSKRLYLHQPESQITLVKRAGSKPSGSSSGLGSKISNIFKSKPKSPPAHVPRPGHFDPASAHEPPPMRQGTTVKPGYQLPAHMTQRQTEKTVYFDPVALGLVKPSSSSPKSKGKGK